MVVVVVLGFEERKGGGGGGAEERVLMEGELRSLCKSTPCRPLFAGRSTSNGFGYDNFVRGRVSRM